MAKVVNETEQTTAEPLVGEVETPQVQSITPTGDGAAALSVKTLEQDLDEKLEGRTYVEMANNIFSGEWKPMVGGFVEAITIFPAREKKFDSSAFVQSDRNFLNAGTGLLRNNRNELDRMWKQAYRFEMVDCDRDENIHYVPLNYRKGKYANRVLGDEFITKAKANLNWCFELSKATDLLFGADYLRADGSTIHCNGLKDLVTNAKAGGLELFSTVESDLTGYAHKYISLSSDLDPELDTSTDLLQFSRLNSLLKFGESVTSCFSFGTTAATAANPVKFATEGISGKCKLGIKVSSFYKLQAKNLQFYKDLEKLYENGLLVLLHPTGLASEFLEGELATTPFDIDYGVNGLNIEDDEIILYQPNANFKRTYAGTKHDVSQFTVNNITDTETATDLWGFDYKPTGVFAVIKASKLFDLSEKIVP